MNNFFCIIIKFKVVQKVQLLQVAILIFHKNVMQKLNFLKFLVQSLQTVYVYVLMKKVDTEAGIDPDIVELNI